jgi:RING finger family protein
MAGRTCPYDQVVIKPGEDVVVCSQCEVAHHKECWEANSGCTTMGCSGTPQVAGTGSGPHVTMKVCPYCAEEIRAAAKVCKHCGEWLPGWSAETAAGSAKSARGSSDPQAGRRLWTRRILLTLAALGVVLATLPAAGIHWSVRQVWPWMMPLALVAYLGAFCGPRWAMVVVILWVLTAIVIFTVSPLLVEYGETSPGYAVWDATGEAARDATGETGSGLLQSAFFRLAALCLTGLLAGTLARRNRWYLGLLAFPVIAGGAIGWDRYVTYWYYGSPLSGIILAGAACVLMYATGPFVARWLRGVEKW